MTHREARQIAEDAAAANFDRDDIVFPLVVASCERAIAAREKLSEALEAKRVK